MLVPSNTSSSCFDAGPQDTLSGAVSKMLTIGSDVLALPHPQGPPEYPSKTPNSAVTLWSVYCLIPYSVSTVGTSSTVINPAGQQPWTSYQFYTRGRGETRNPSSSRNEKRTYPKRFLLSICLACPPTKWPNIPAAPSGQFGQSLLCKYCLSIIR